MLDSKEFIKGIKLFQNHIPDEILYIFNKLKNKGFEVYLVGGAVRDLIISGSYDKTKLAYSDFDFTTNAKPNEVISLFRERGLTKVYTVPTGLAHGTVTVLIEKDDIINNFEITTYRLEGVYHDGRHPSTVEFTTSLTEDLSRRDFTINALAYDVLEDILVDPFGGLRDINDKLIRTVGNPVDRFNEDGLRPIRACRFSSQLNFKIEKNTLDTIPGVLDVVSKVSQERVHDELIKLMKSEKPSIGLEYMRESGIMKLVLPELLEGYQVDQNEFHKHDVYYHNLFTCDAVSRDKPLVRLAGLFHDIGKTRAKNYALTNGNGNVFYNHEVISERMAEKILKRLKFSNQDLKIVKNLVKMHMFYYTEEWTDGAVRRFLRKTDGESEFLENLFELRRADRIGSGMRSGDTEILEKFKKRLHSIIEADNALRVTDLDINGYDIMEHYKIKPSKQVGETLEYMLQKVLDNPSLNKKELLLQIGEEFLKEYPKHCLKDEEKEDLEIMV